MDAISSIILTVIATKLDWINPVVAGCGVILSVAMSLVIAIFGDDLRALFRRPKLWISLPDLEGEWTILTDHETKKITDHAIYFHALLKNQKPFRIARDVELYVIECTVSDVERENTPMPLPCPLPIKARRKHSGVEVGAAPFAYDLFRCLESSRRIELLLNCNRPNNFTAWISQKGTMRLTIEARGMNAVSNKLIMKVSWDGVFPKEVDGLGQHLVVSQECDYGNRPCSKLTSI